MTTPVTREVPVTVRVFVQRFSSTPRGARLARRLAVHQLHRWGFPYGSEASGTVELLVAELAANAVTHGRVPGRDCELTLTYTPGLLLRVDVSDTRGEQPAALRGAGPCQAHRRRGRAWSAPRRGAGLAVDGARPRTGREDRTGGARSAPDPER